MKLSDVKIGDTFKVAGIDFIKFSQDGERVIAVSKDSLFNSNFGKNNVFAKSDVLKELQKNILPKLEKEIGTENILEFETELLSLDGSDAQGKLISKISLVTLDFYRANVKLFDKHKLEDWWWLATPWSTPEHTNDYWTLCVSPRGHVGNDSYFTSSRGVRPILHFVSSISVSCEDE